MDTPHNTRASVLAIGFLDRERRVWTLEDDTHIPLSSHQTLINNNKVRPLKATRQHSESHSSLARTRPEPPFSPCTSEPEYSISSTCLALVYLAAECVVWVLMDANDVRGAVRTGLWGFCCRRHPRRWRCEVRRLRERQRRVLVDWSPELRTRTFQN